MTRNKPHPSLPKSPRALAGDLGGERAFLVARRCGDEDFEADPDEIPKALDPKDVTDVQDDRRPKTTLTDLFPKTTSGLTKIEEV